MDLLQILLELFQFTPIETNALIGTIGAGVGVAMRTLWTRRAKLMHVRLETAQIAYTTAREMAVVIEALKTQIDALMIENQRLRGDLTSARNEIHQLSNKLDVIESWMQHWAELRKEECPAWKNGEPCPLIDAYEAKNA